MKSFSESVAIRIATSLLTLRNVAKVEQLFRGIPFSQNSFTNLLISLKGEILPSEETAMSCLLL